MAFGYPFAQPEPTRPPCEVRPDPLNDNRCGRPSGEHTALDYPICDDCWEAIREVAT